MLSAALLAGLTMPGLAYAHPDAKHAGDRGHLPGKAENVRLIGEAMVSDRTPDPATATADMKGIQGRIADVNVFGNFAYLAAFNSPTCEDGGIYVVDVTDPTKPAEVKDAFIPTAPGSYVGEGVHVLEIGARDVLLFNNEICAEGGLGGMTLVDVTDPRKPVVLAANVGDTDTDGEGGDPVHDIHSVFGWNDDGRSYAVLVDNAEEEDVDIFDITDPTRPVKVSETSYVDDTRVVQDNPPNGDSQFLHDMVVKEVDGRQIMLASYWDNGYLILDVEDPANPVLLRDTDFAATEPFAAQLGLPAGFEPEGNAHQAEFSPNNEFFIGTDEDFNPFRVVATISSGPNSGKGFTASQGSGEPNVDQDRSVTGPTVYGGFGCDAASVPQGGATQTVLIERAAPPGQEACTFQAKYDNAVAKGFGTVIVFNNQRADCQALVNPAVVEKDAPFIFVSRGDGLAILNQTASSNACTQASPSIGTRGGNIDIKAVFDGWGYVHLYDAKTMEDLGQYAIPESLDADKASGLGDLSVHEVAMDPKVPGRAYLSYYSGGFRVIEYDRTGIREIGAYIDSDGSNLWGVEYWTSPTTGQDYVLASDRDFGLQIFQYDPTVGGGKCSVVPTVTLERSTINATGSSGVTVKAPAGAVVDLFAYSQPSTTFQRVRTGTVGANGSLAFTALRPPTNTRVYAQIQGCMTDASRHSVVLNVRTTLSLAVERNGVRDYTFSGSSLPARPGGLIVSLYRVTDNGRQVLAAQTRASSSTGKYTINRKFTGSGRFGFTVRTGQDLRNAPGVSNVRSLLVF